MSEAGGRRRRGRHAAPGGSFYRSLLVSPLVISALLGIVIGVIVGLVWWQSRNIAIQGPPTTVTELPASAPWEALPTGP